MTYVRNIDRKMKVVTEESFPKTSMNERKMDKKFKQIYYSDDGYWRGKIAI